MQLQSARDTSGRRLGVVATARAVARVEGVAAFWGGLGPALARGVFYGGTRLGLYGPAKDALARHAPAAAAASPLLAGVAAGALSGCAAAALTNPIDLVKTRLQAPRPPGAPRPTALATAATVARAGGPAALWAGTGPSMARAAVQTASQCAAYDAAKRGVGRATGWRDGPAVHLCASALTGLVTTTCTAPIDVVKTRMMVAAGEGGGGGGRPRASPWRVARDLVSSEGPAALLKGWTTQFLRLAPQSVITFMVLEQLKRAAGLAPV
jgi:solute carrier family 25 uncoupling protein 8/9